MFRQVLLKIHRYLGLTFGLLLVIAALSGSLLTVARPLDKAFNPKLFKSSENFIKPTLLEESLVKLKSEFGEKASFTFRPPHEANDTLWVKVKSNWVGTIYFDPSSAKELGRRGAHEGWVNVLLEIHESLFLDETGKMILTFAAFNYLLMLITGIYLWWPKKWKHAWSIKLNSSSTRMLFDIHRVGGTLLGLLILISVVTGAYMAYKPIGTTINNLMGSKPEKSIVLDKTIGKTIALDEQVHTAQQIYPGIIGYVQVSTGKPTTIRVKLFDDPHPNGRSSVAIHPISGIVLQQQRWNQTDTATMLNSVIYPLHIGQLAGVYHTVFVGIIGLALAGLGISGLILWWRRR